MIAGIYNIDDSIYNAELVRRFVRNETCVLAYKSSKMVSINGTLYKNVKGFAITSANPSTIEISFMNNECVKIQQRFKYSKVNITKKDSIILINTFK